MNKPFLYLVQSAQGLPESYQQLQSERSDVLLLTFKKQLEGAIYLPKSTWNQGRNRLIEEAKQKEPYLYYIFLDDDVNFVKGSFKEFEDALLEYQPAIATPYFPEYFKGESIEKKFKAQNCYYFDAIFNAFHRDVLMDDVIIPYYRSFDKESWCYSQLFVMRLANIFYPDHTLQINTVWIENPKHAEYPRGENFRTVQRWFSREVLKKRTSPIDPYILEKVSRRLPKSLARLAWKAHRPFPKLPSYRIPAAKKTGALHLDASFWKERGSE